VIFYEGFTDPAAVKPEEVRGELHADITEKKQRIEMARYFTHLREGAAIDNFLAGTSQSPAAPRGNVAGGPSGMPVSTLTAAEAAELAKPRAGSRQAERPAPPTAGSRVVPAAHEAP